MLQRAAVQILHGDEGMALRFTDVVDGAYIGMVQRTGGASLAAESADRGWILREPLGQELQRNQATESNVASFVNHSHSAASELFENAVVRDGPLGHIKAGFE